MTIAARTPRTTPTISGRATVRVAWAALELSATRSVLSEPLRSCGNGASLPHAACPVSLTIVNDEPGLLGSGHERGLG
jgi:hypothetical protein